MATSPPSTGPRWAYGPGAVLPDPPISTAQRAAGFAINQILTAGQLNGLFKNLGEWITYLRGPRGAYASLEGAASVMEPGDTVTIYENDSATIPGNPLTGYRTGAVYAQIAATSDVVIVSTSAGTISVFSRSTPGGTAVRTMTVAHVTLSVSALTIYGDYLAVAYGNYVELFRISTGASLWNYLHGAPVADVQISGAYLVLVGDAGTGGFEGRVLRVADGTQVDTISHGGALKACAFYGRNVAVAGDPGTAGNNARGYLLDGTLTSIWDATVATGGTLNTLRTDGRNLYTTELAYAYCLSFSDGGQLATADILRTTVAPIQWMAVDQGGVYVYSTDGTSNAVLQRLALGTCSLVWESSLVVPAQNGIATDGARIWSANSTGGSSNGILTFARGNCAGQWTKVDTSVTTYQRFGWLLVPGVE